MSAHYKQPILLIEFEEHKSFSLEVPTPSSPPYALLSHPPPRRQSPT